MERVVGGKCDEQCIERKIGRQRRIECDEQCIERKIGRQRRIKCDEQCIEQQNRTAKANRNTSSPRMLRSTYANMAYDVYQPTMSRNAFIAELLGHQLYDDATSLSYVGVSISRPIRRLPSTAERSQPNWNCARNRSPHHRRSLDGMNRRFSFQAVTGLRQCARRNRGWCRPGGSTDTTVLPLTTSV